MEQRWGEKWGAGGRRPVCTQPTTTKTHELTPGMAKEARHRARGAQRSGTNFRAARTPPLLSPRYRLPPHALLREQTRAGTAPPVHWMDQHACSPVSSSKKK